MAKVEAVAKEKRGEGSSGRTSGEKVENGTNDLIGGSRGVGGNRCKDCRVECW